ncbi:conserved hypothetical protein [Desulfamplus magnetovallimortis]|uniref:Protein nucleotidyltransferase YdiU n=1 Tax=Desulfamplus magnetovallimortis TaxID=1246637 RepID=A0A1W1H838_9BACT|nr:protein adenylyltransferase SelO [Desulfamplus magnetovallimortis]SLM28545.1 conserved hypothetical protein [Desulfamplus magnetovallimortis]
MKPLNNESASESCNERDDTCNKQNDTCNKQDDTCNQQDDTCNEQDDKYDAFLEFDSLVFDNKFIRDLPGDPEIVNFRRQVKSACFSRVKPKKAANPELVAYSKEAALLLGLSEKSCRSTLFTDVFSGNRLLSGMEPYATCYGGHQFGNWAGQLGDGRAINLGEIIGNSAKKGSGNGTNRWVIQLKGAGPTPYSRNADGLAVLRSSLREFLCSEAMHHLGIPTTRALSLILTGDTVIRDMFYDGHPKEEQGAVVCRLAPSFTRFGNFEIHASRGETEILRKLVDYTIMVDFPEIVSGRSDSPEIGAERRDFSESEVDASREYFSGTDAGRKGFTNTPKSLYTKALYIEWFNDVCRRTADLIAQWMGVGFVHGVMNTDNMSILGLTIDYGPYGWLDNYDPDWTPNTTDAQGRRYRFGNQMNIAQWNLAQLANAIYPLIGEVEPLEKAIYAYSSWFEKSWQKMVAAKLGFKKYESSDDMALFRDLFGILSLVETDMTIFFRKLGDYQPGSGFSTFMDAYYAPEQLTADYKDRLEHWLASYAGRISRDDLEHDERRRRMNCANPKYVLRNYLAQMAIDKAEGGDFSMVHKLLEVLRNPFSEQPENEIFAVKRPEWARHRPGCSMLSCSS